MNQMLQGVHDREKGAYPVSLGTSIALEALAGNYPERPVNPPPIREMKEVWFNLRTLLRNLQGALASDVRDRVTHGALVPSLIEELSLIESIIISMSSGNARAVFYVCDYSSIRQKFPKTGLRVPTTPKQIMHDAIEKAVIRALLDHGVSQDLRTFRYELDGRNQPAFILTHLPIDLLSRYAFSKLELLESHTGNIKKPAQWNTKLTNGKELVNIPFCRFSLQVFGDNGNHFAPAPRAVKEIVLDLADKYRWTSITTDLKIRESIKSISHPADRTALLSLL